MKNKISYAQMYQLFEIYLRSAGIPVCIREYLFNPPRKWRIDFAWPVEGLAVEIEGGVWANGRHTRGSGFVGDMEKYNTLSLTGYQLLRFTPDQVAKGYALKIIEQWFTLRQGSGKKYFNKH